MNNLNCNYPHATILLVDDDKHLIEILRYCLVKAGYKNIYTETDSNNVIRLYKKLQPDVMLLDYRMPDLLGTEIITELSADGKAYLPIIMLTADSDPEIKYEALVLGAQDFIAKPFNEVEVLARINTTIQTSILQKQLRQENDILDVQYTETHSALQTEIQARTDAESMLQYNLLHDPLTRLPNKLLFTDRLDQVLEHCRRKKSHLAVLLMNIDNIKSINQSLGHQYGDQFLASLSSRIKSVTRSIDPVMYNHENQNIARLSGNSFLFGLGHLDNKDQALEIFARILAEIVKPYCIDEITVEPICHTGIAYYPDDGETIADLIQHADTAAYYARSSMQSICVYTPEFDQDALRNLQIMQDLKKAISENELSLYLQPKLDIKSNHISSYECLLRWIHPQHGFIPPDVFIKIAEDTGQIASITQWVIENTCKHIQLLQSKNLSTELSLNFTASDLMNRAVIQYLVDTTHAYKVNPRNLTLEITEGSMIADPSQAHEIISELSERGFQLSIDDFGTGYSSLAYLQKLAVHELKIDKSFVMDLDTNLDNQMIVRSIIDIAHHLHLRVVAEGIENPESLAHLAAFDCDYAQGFYICKPQPIDKIIEFVTHYSCGSSIPYSRAE